MKIIDCIGSPRQRGLAHGESLRAEIATALENWIAATIVQPDVDGWCARFIDDTGLMRRVNALTPDLYAEIEGIAAGSGQSFARIAAYNLMDEQWWYNASPSAPPPGCSLVAFPVQGGHLLAQNMDLPEHMNGSQVVLRLGGPDLPETLMLSGAGMIGLTGMNAAGLAVGVNTLLMLRHSVKGLPVAFVLRHVIASRTKEEANRRLRALPHASGQHYALLTQDGIDWVECSASGCVEGDARDVLLHTNHPLVSTDVDATAQQRLDAAGFSHSSTDRLEWLHNNVSQMKSKAGAQALFDNPHAPICMRASTHRGSATFATVLYEITHDPSVCMRAGTADTLEWQLVPFTHL